MSDPGPYQCTLDRADAPERAIQARRLTAHLVAAQREPGAVVLRFEASAARDVEDFVAAESRCCAFFAFDVSTTETEVLLGVTAPAAAQPMLDALADVFTDDASADANDTRTLPPWPFGA